MVWPEVVLVLGSYLAGSIPFAFLLGLSQGVDIRKAGSGNIGATNLTRLLGRRWGLPAFLLDYAKGLGPVLLGQALFSGDPFSREPDRVALAAGAAAILGHVFPLYLGFRGGKAVATTFGAMTALDPLSTLCASLAWAALYGVARVVSLASLGAVLVLPVAVWFFHRDLEWRRYLELEVFAVAVVALVLLRHRSNLVRLLCGEESAFRKKGG